MTYAAVNRRCFLATHWLINVAKANPNTHNNFGATPLHKAAGERQLDIVRCLVEDGAADCAARNGEGLTAVHLAAAAGWLVGLIALLQVRPDPGQGWPTFLAISAVAYMR